MTTILIVESNTPDLVAREVSRGGTGLAEQFGGALLEIDETLSIDIVAPYAGETFDADGADGIVFTGSSVAWNTSDERAAPLQEAMSTALASGLPVHGSCNGMQLAASVLGGMVGASPKGHEDGIARDIQLSEDGRHHPMMIGRSNGFGVPCVHRDEVQKLPNGARLLASNAHCVVQAFAYEKDGADFWGCQYHPEYAPSFVADGLKRYRPEKAELADLMARCETEVSAAATLGTTPQDQRPEVRMTELRNWLTHVKARQALKDVQARYVGAVPFYFGDSPQMADELLELVRAGKKRATCGRASDFKPLGDEEPPKEGRYDVVTRMDGTPVLVVRTTSVTRKTFAEIDEDFALAEGENESLQGWQADHRRYFERNGGWSKNMELICERFEVVEDLTANEGTS